MAPLKYNLDITGEVVSRIPGDGMPVDDEEQFLRPTQLAVKRYRRRLCWLKLTLYILKSVVGLMVVVFWAKFTRVFFKYFIPWLSLALSDTGVMFLGYCIAKLDIARVLVCPCDYLLHPFETTAYRQLQQEIRTVSCIYGQPLQIIMVLRVVGRTTDKTSSLMSEPWPCSTSCRASSPEYSYWYVLHVLPWDLMHRDKIRVTCPNCQKAGKMDPSQLSCRCTNCLSSITLDFPVLEPDEKLLSEEGKDDGQEVAPSSDDAGVAPFAAESEEICRASRTSGSPPRSQSKGDPENDRNIDHMENQEKHVCEGDGQLHGGRENATEVIEDSMRHAEGLPEWTLSQSVLRLLAEQIE